MFFDPLYFLFAAPGFLLGMWAQMRVKSTFARSSKVPARLSGAAIARHLLDEAGLQNVPVEQTPGRLSDHYDPRAKKLRLSQDVYHGRNMAAAGVAAHEAGHAIQDARGYLPLIVRNAAVPAANFGSNAAFLMMMAGFMMQFGILIYLGIAAFGLVVFFQLVNLPVEFDASSRAKQLLEERGIVPRDEMVHVRKVLNAAALTYVAATLQAAMTLAYYIYRYAGSRN